MFKSYGYVKYSPNRPLSYKKKDWWCILHIDPEICKYYKWFIDKQLNPLNFDTKKQARNNGFDILNIPSFGYHMSIIRGNNDVKYNIGKVKELWKKYENAKIYFEYSNDIKYKRKNNIIYYYIDLQSNDLYNIREEMGLPCFFLFHVTIGIIIQ